SREGGAEHVPRGSLWGHHSDWRRCTGSHCRSRLPRLRPGEIPHEFAKVLTALEGLDIGLVVEDCRVRKVLLDGLADVGHGAVGIGARALLVFGLRPRTALRNG